jgi:hypothetical protein
LEELTQNLELKFSDDEKFDAKIYHFKDGDKHWPGFKALKETLT